MVNIRDEILRMADGLQFDEVGKGEHTHVIDAGDISNATSEVQVINYETGDYMPYDEFVNLTDLSRIIPEGFESFSREQMMSLLRAESVDIEGVNSSWELSSFLQENYGWKGDNTYNWSWFGPILNLNYGSIGTNYYVAIAPHYGGDPRGNYGEYTFILVGNDEEDIMYEALQPIIYGWNYTAAVDFEVEGNQYRAVLRSDDAEAYNLEIYFHDPIQLQYDGKTIKNGDILPVDEWLEIFKLGDSL